MAGEIQIGGTTFATESGGTVTVSNVDSATNRQNLGLEIGVDVQSFDADTTKNDVANTFTANQIISVTDNTNAALRVTQLGTGNALVVEDSANPDSTPFVIDASGKVGIGTSPSYGRQLDIAFSSNSGPAIVGNDTTPQNGNTFFEFRNNGTFCGSITSNGSTTTVYNEGSDYRLKTNTQPMTGATERLKALNPINFEWISTGERVDGFLAHEVQAIVPEAVTGEKDAVNEDGSINPQGIDKSKLVPLLTAALQEAITLIESQQSQIDALTARIEVLETT